MIGKVMVGSLRLLEMVKRHVSYGSPEPLASTNPFTENLPRIKSSFSASGLETRQSRLLHDVVD